MSETDFWNMYLCEFPRPSTKDLYLEELAKEYFRVTDEYDKSLMIRPDGDRRFWDMGLVSKSNKHALEVKAELYGKAYLEKGLLPSDVDKAIKDYGMRREKC